jgi:hypothetical protein
MWFVAMGIKILRVEISCLFCHRGYVNEIHYICRAPAPI